MLEIFSNFCLDFICLLGLLGLEGNEFFFFFLVGKKVIFLGIEGKNYIY